MRGGHAIAASEPPIGEENRIFATGELLDGVYEIMQLLGRGGMGQVFEAHDHLLNRRVAIKAAWPNPLSPPLRNEARALAAFQHRSLVGVYTLGEHRGIDYLVMERIYGVSLTQHASTRFDGGEVFSAAEVIELPDFGQRGQRTQGRPGGLGGQPVDLQDLFRGQRGRLSEVDGKRHELAYWETGSAGTGPMIVLIHGVLSDSRTWDYIRGEMGDRYTRQTIASVERMDIPDAEKKMIFEDNTRKLLKL